MSRDLELNRICVATDFSQTSDRAVRYAVGLAERFDAEQHLLHVLQDISLVLGHPDFTASGETVQQFLAELESDAAGRLEELTATPWWETINVVRAIRHGVVYQEICRYAERRNIDLLILGTHGRTGLKHVFLGSVAERVVRTAPCPVLTVRHPAHRVTLPAEQTEADRMPATHVAG
jgi:nucleotide-binding universal stress UspA family protein